MDDKNMLPIIGTMSGTSMDGIDVTYVHTNGEKIIRTNISEIYSYSKNTIKHLKKVSNQKITFNYNNSLEELSYEITIDHANCIKKILRKIDDLPCYIGFHGQTIYHNPQEKMSVQLGNPQLLADILNINVVSNFRNKDLKLGGQGAPLAPIYHKCIIEEFDIKLPSCFINIGGITNLTYWDGKKLLGLDIGPGNVLMDDYCFKNLNLTFDYNGNMAAQGIYDEQTISYFLKDKFFDIKGTKSLDKRYFNYIHEYVSKKNLNQFDILATLLECTLKAIEISIKQLPSIPKFIYLVGGGAKNITLVDKLKRRLSNINVLNVKSLGLNEEMIEAELISFLSARSILGLPFTFSTTTGVKKPCCGGKIFKPN